MLMDWTMVSNAEGPLRRVHTLAYLLMERYAVNSDDAGRMLAAKEHDHELRNETISELRGFLSDANVDLAYMKFRTNVDVRNYLGKFLTAFDSAINMGAQ